LNKALNIHTIVYSQHLGLKTIIIHINLDVELPVFNGGETSMVKKRKSQRANQPGGEQARGRTGKGVKPCNFHSQELLFSTSKLTWNFHFLTFIFRPILYTIRITDRWK